MQTHLGKNLACMGNEPMSMMAISPYLFYTSKTSMEILSTYYQGDLQRQTPVPMIMYSQKNTISANKYLRHMIKYVVNCLQFSQFLQDRTSYSFGVHKRSSTILGKSNGKLKFSIHQIEKQNSILQTHFFLTKIFKFNRSHFVNKVV